MARRTSVTPEKIEQAALLYAEGYTLKEITLRHGYSISTWHQLLSKRVKKGYRPSERDVEMVLSHRAGESFTVIATKSGITRQRVHQIVKRAESRVDKSQWKAIVAAKKEIRDE